MIASYALTDNIPERSLGSFVSGYGPVERNRLALSAVPIVLFVCSGFFAMNQPPSGNEQPAMQALVMAFSRIDTSETKSTPALTDSIEVVPEPFPAEQSPPKPTQQIAAANAIVEPALPEMVAVDRLTDQPVDPVAPDTVARSKETETIIDAAPEVATITEPVTVPRPPKKPVQESRMAEATAAEPVPVATQALEPEPVNVEPVRTEPMETEPSAKPVAELQDTLPDRQHAAPEAATDPSEPIVIVDPDFLVPPKPPVYPPISMKRHEQGTVVVRALVSGAGAAREVRVWQSSGFRRLDRAAQVAVQDWQFAPAVRLGLPVAAWVEVPVHFQLN